MQVFVALLVIASVTGKRSPKIGLKGAAPSACGCQCSDLVWEDKYGTVHGNCRSADHTKAKWCYVKEGSTCSDLVPSARHPRNPWSYQACATPTQAQCGSGTGGFSTSGGNRPSRQPNNGAFGSNGRGQTHSSSGSHSTQQSQEQFSSAFGSSGLSSGGSSGYGTAISSGSGSRPQALGSSGHNGGFVSSGNNGAFGSSGQNGGLGSLGHSGHGGFGSSGQNGGIGSSGQNGGFGSSGHNE